jgi:O-acetyl-ADP-ribose deacetylase (regulator of RNase III)
VPGRQGKGADAPTSIEIARGDIAEIAVDAIVNAANESLQLGSGVAGAIRRGGGPSIQEECDRIGRCLTGGAVVTGAGALPARWVIHAVGPVWRGGSDGEDALLASAVSEALARAEECGAASVAIPAISTGVYGFPVERAAAISVRAARRFAASARVVSRVVFVLRDDLAAAAFARELDASRR